MNSAERDRIRRSVELLQKAAPRPTAELLPYERNQKDHSDAQVEQIAVSLRRFGWRQPIVVDGRGVIVIGHGRWLAARKLGLDTVPVVDAADLTADEIRELRIIDNKLNESPWNDFLAEDLQELTFEGFDFADMETGATKDGEPEEAAEVIEDEPPEPPEEPRTRPGDLYQLGVHRLLCGDSTSAADIDRLIDGNFMRLTVTSPPYGVGKDYEEKGIEPWKQTISGVISAIAGKTLIIGWNIGDLYSTGTQFTEPTGAYSIQMMSDAGYGLLYTRIWKKPGGNFAGNNPYYTVTTKPVQDYEFLFAFAERDADKHVRELQQYLFAQAKIAKLNNETIKSMGGPGFMYGHWFTEHQWSLIDEKNYTMIARWCRDNGVMAFLREYAEIKQEYLTNTIFSHNLPDEEFSNWGLYGVWEFNTVHERLGGHAAAFPVELPARYIKMHTYPGNMVLDPFGGTGTTLIACEQLKRQCFMMERDPHYCDVIVQRWENFTGQKAVLLTPHDE